MANKTLLRAHILRRPTTRYVVSLAVMAAALAVGLALSARVPDYLPYVLVFTALAFSAWYCGLGPSVAATALALAALKYWLIPPVHTFAIQTVAQAFGITAILLASIAMMVMGEARVRENEALRHSQDEMEERVKERTAELDAANDGLRDLTARLMQLQDDERRRIARELHDSVGQTLAALSMNLAAVGNDIERLSQTAKRISDSADLVQEMNKEVRTISHLLHPPLLDEAGLVSALRWYVDGFSQRSRIEVDLEVADDFQRLPTELEIGIFRTVQECLTNIHRHSGSQTARIRLVQAGGEVRLQVEDGGAGIAPEKLNQVSGNGIPGVGISGMRERIRQLGGTLEITSDSQGTIVKAHMPGATLTRAA